MTERMTVQPTRELPAIEGGPFHDPQGGDLPGTVNVGAGIYSHEALPVAGMTVEQVRRTFAARLDIDPQATPVLDGAAAGESTVLRAGQTLTFFRPSGEKGGRVSGLVQIDGETVRVATPEGVTATMSVRDLAGQIAPERLSTGDLIVPDGVRMMHPAGPVTVFVWELHPAVHHVRWISPESKAPYGDKATYRHRALALPYLVIVAVFATGRTGLYLTGTNEAYFRSGPIKGLDDELCFPALLNISRFGSGEAEGRPLAWICTQHTNLGSLAREPDLNLRVRRSLDALRRTVLEATFNHSSDEHEGSSWYTQTARKVPEIADLDRWEAFSRERPLRALEIPWLPARWAGRPLTIRRLLERIGAAAGPAAAPPSSSADIARMVVNAAARKRTPV